MWELINAINKQALALAAFKCQAHARALMYFESHLRTRQGGGALNKAANHHVSTHPHSNKICFTGTSWKIVSTYEPKIMLTRSPA
eukprot:1180293-Prorocentrum_minimum.AAC.1